MSVFLTHTKCVYSAVRAASLNIIQVYFHVTIFSKSRSVSHFLRTVATMSPFLTLHSIKRTQITYSYDTQSCSKQAELLYFYIGQEVALTLLERLLGSYKYFPFNSKPEGRQNICSLWDRLVYVCS